MEAIVRKWIALNKEWYIPEGKNFTVKANFVYEGNCPWRQILSMKAIVRKRIALNQEWYIPEGKNLTVKANFVYETSLWDSQ